MYDRITRARKFLHRISVFCSEFMFSFFFFFRKSVFCCLSSCGAHLSLGLPRLLDSSRRQILEILLRPFCSCNPPTFLSLLLFYRENKLYLIFSSVLTIVIIIINLFHLLCILCIIYYVSVFITCEFITSLLPLVISTTHLRRGLQSFCTSLLYVSAFCV